MKIQQGGSEFQLNVTNRVGGLEDYTYSKNLDRLHVLQKTERVEFILKFLKKKIPFFFNNNKPKLIKMLFLRLIISLIFFK